MKPARFPVLFESGSSLDWHKASYRADVQLKGKKAIIVHYLEGAPQLDRVIESGEAQWVTELRCPRTLLYRQERSSERTQQVAWNETEMVGQTYLVPGLVAEKDLVLDVSGLNSFVWSSSTTMEIPCGWWLARAESRRVEPLVASLVKFRLDKNLDAGRMAVEEDIDGSNPCFVVRMASNLYEERKDNRDIQIAGLIGACAWLPRSSMGRDTNGQDREHHDHVLAQELRRRFEEAKVPDWESDDFDPVQAATVLEPFHIPVAGEAE
ncbi:MAG: hypothetical protein OXE04_02570 [bacterium]|nr:hypothetical protein [bacterium]